MDRRTRRGQRVPGRPRAHRRALRRVRRRTLVPQRRPRPLPARRRTGVPGPRRPPGEDRRPPHRTRRGRVRPGGRPRRAARGRLRPGHPRTAPRRSRLRARGRTGSGPGAASGGTAASGLHGPRAPRRSARPSAERQRQTGPGRRPPDTDRGGRRRRPPDLRTGRPGGDRRGGRVGRPAGRGRSGPGEQLLPPRRRLPRRDPDDRSTACRRIPPRPRRRPLRPPGAPALLRDAAPRGSEGHRDGTRPRPGHRPGQRPRALPAHGRPGRLPHGPRPPLHPRRRRYLALHGVRRHGRRPGPAGTRLEHPRPTARHAPRGRGGRTPARPARRTAPAHTGGGRPGRPRCRPRAGRPACPPVPAGARPRPVAPLRGRGGALPGRRRHAHPYRRRTGLPGPRRPLHHHALRRTQRALRRSRARTPARRRLLPRLPDRAARRL